jgi:hypothetical protein
MAEQQDGFGLIWRRFQRHRFWAEKRVFNRAEAWLDCWLFMAAYEAHSRVVAGITTRLERGQFIASERFLERRWSWSRGRVRRFIQDCIDNGEILRVSSVNGGCAVDDNAGGTVYLVVNYEECQLRSTTDGTTDGPATVPLTDQIETSKRKKKKQTSSSPSAFDLLFEAEWFEYPKKTAKAEAKREWDKAIQKDDAKLIAAGIRRYVAMMQAKGTDRQYYAKLVNFLKDEAWRDAWEVEGVVPIRKGETEDWWLREVVV